MKKLVICLAMLLSSMAFANIHVPTLNPTFDGNDYLKTLSARTLLQNQWYFGIVSNFEHRPLKFKYDKIDFRHTLSLASSVGLFDTFSLGLFIPFVTTQSNSIQGRDSQSYGLGNITVSAKWTWLATKYFSSALAFPLHLPTFYGNENLLGDKSVGFSSQLIFEGHTKYVSLALNGGVRVRNIERLNFGNSSMKVYDEAFGSLGLTIPIIGSLSLIGDASVAMDVDKGGSGKTPAEALGGFKVNIGGWSFKLGAGAGLTKFNGTPEARMMASLGWTFTPNKTQEIKYVPVIVDVPCPMCKKCEKCEEKKCETVSVKLRNSDLVSVYFEFDKDTPISTESLDAVLDELRMFPTLKVVLNGFTDIIGSDKYNMGLSLRRANNVKKYLESKGISSDRILVVPRGEKESFGIEMDEMAEDRRVDAAH